MPKFKMGKNKMVYDRGRYKTSDNKGSRSEKKGKGFLAKAAKLGSSVKRETRKAIKKYGKPEAIAKGLGKVTGAKERMRLLKKYGSVMTKSEAKKKK